MPSNSRRLQERIEVSTRQDRLGLLEGLDLLITGGLADLEILHDEITALVELGIVVRELLELEKDSLLVFIGLIQVSLCLGLLLGLVNDLLGLGLDGCVGLFHEILICLLGILFSADGLCLHCLGIVDDLLDHAHDTTRRLVLGIVLEAWRRRRTSRLLLLKECCLLLIETLQDVQGGSQQLLGSSLIRNCLLKLLVLLLTVLTSTLHLHLHLSNLRLEACDVSRESFDGELEVLDESNEILLLTVLLLSLELIGIELLDAEVLVFDFISLLLQKLSNHVINGLLDLDEGIKTHVHGNGREARAVQLLGNGCQHCGCLGAALGMHLGLDKSRVECLGEKVMCIIRTENSQSLGAGLHLKLTSFLALFPLCIGVRALLLEHHQELLISRQGSLGVLQRFLGFRQFLISGGELLGLLVNLILTCLDLVSLGLLQILICLLVGHLFLLAVRQICFEALLHLLQDSEDLTRLWRIRLLEGWCGIKIVLRSLEECSHCPALMVSQDSLQHCGILVHLVLNCGRNTLQMPGRDLQESTAMVLAEHSDCRLEGRDSLERILLLGVELCKFLLPDGSGCIEGLLILGNFFLQVLDLSGQAGTGCSQLLNLVGEVFNLGLRI